MISVESSDVLGLGFVVGEEMEEGEALYYQNHDEDDDLTVDPDVALSYIDEKLQDVLGHFQKDFEGGVSAENLGAKFGGYGSFLPTYQRSPALSHQRTPPKVHTYSSPRSPNNLHLEGGLHDSVNESSASISARIGTVSLGVVSLPALKTPSANDSVKRNVCMSSTHAKESTSKCALIKSSNYSDQKIFKVRIKVGSDNLSTRKMAEIYSGLGLDISPSSSLNDSPMDSEFGLDLSPDESPTSILQIMTSCPAHGSLMLTPLPDDSICLIQKEKLHGLSRSGSVCKSGDQENSVIFMNGSDSARAGPEMLGEKKTKPSNKYSFSLVDLNNGNGCDTRNGIGVLLKKETDLATESCEELVSNAVRLPLLSNSYFNVANSAEDTVREIDSSSLAIKGGVNDKSFSALAKEEPLESISTEEHRLVEKRNEEFVSDGRVCENKKENYDGDESVYWRKGEKHDVSVKGDSNVCKGRKPLKTELVDTQVQKTGQKATSHEEDGIKLAPVREQSSSGGKKKSKIDYSCVPKSKTSTHVDSYVSKIEVVDLKKDHGKARDTYIALFGDLELEQDSKEKSLEEFPYQERLKNPAVVEISKFKSNSEPKERSNVRKIEKPSSSAAYPRAGTNLALASGNGPIANASGTVAPLVNEDWVCCDKCQKWRLLPFGTNPDSLPEKWLCSMLYWLPGMNRCNIGEEETTKAVVALSQFPTRAPAVAPTSHSIPHGHPSGSLSGLSSADGHIDQNRLDPGLNDMPSVGKKKCGLKDVSNEANHDGPTQFSNSIKNPQAPTKSRSLNGVNHSPTVNEVDFHSSGPYSSLVVEKHRHKRKEKDKKKLRESYSGRGDSQSSKKRNKKESNQDCFTASKKFNSDNGSTHMADDSDAVKKRKGNEYLEIQNHNTSLPSAGNHLQDSRGFMEVSNENDHRKEKKARVSRSAGKETCTSKGSGGADRKGRSTKDQQVGPHLGRTLSQRSLDAVDSLKNDLGSVQPSLAATSSSSKVSGSHKNKANFQEVKGSPVESVSSSPLRISKREKFTSRGKDDTHDAVFFPTRRSDGEDDAGIDRSEMVKKDETFTVTHHGSLKSSALDLKDRDLGHLSGSKVKADSVPYPEFATCHVTDGHANTLGEEKVNSSQYHANGSRPRKSGKVSSSRSKDKSRNIRPELDKDNCKLSSFNESIAHTPREEKLNAGKNKLHEKFAICSDEVEKNLASEKDSSGKVISGSGKKDSQSKSGLLNGSDAVSSKDPKQNLLLDRDGEKSSKRYPSEKTDQLDVSGRGKSYSLPPSGRAQNETLRCPQPIHRSQKENGANILSVGASEGGDVLKAPKQIKKAENQNGDQTSNLEHPTPNRPKVRDLDAASPIRRDSSSQAATNAIKEAKDLKHLADRLKNSESNSESTGFYFQAALKFLHGASLLESSNSESSKHGETIQSIQVYSSTAELCKFCAHEYEKSRDMASAALAYKCMEVAYMRVIYSSHSSANRDRHELQTALHSVPPGESPSSSASDIDNLNNPATLEKVAVPKGVSSHQVAGNHVIAARNRSNFVRMLNFAQEVNFAMEASRKARISFAAANAKLEESKHKDSTSSVKKALDFNFQDVEGLLRRVRLAMEVISR